MTEVDVEIDVLVVAVGRLIGGCPLSYRTVFGLDEFGVRGKLLDLPGGWTIFDDVAYRIGFLSVVSWR